MTQKYIVYANGDPVGVDYVTPTKAKKIETECGLILVTVNQYLANRNAN